MKPSCGTNCIFGGTEEKQPNSLWATLRGLLGGGGLGSYLSGERALEAAGGDTGKGVAV